MNMAATVNGRPLNILVVEDDDGNWRVGDVRNS